MPQVKVFMGLHVSEWEPVFQTWLDSHPGLQIVSLAHNVDATGFIVATVVYQASEG